MNKNYYIWLFVVIILCGILLFFFVKEKEPNTRLDSFAKCLTEKGVVMYGTYWCSHCKAEKERFGDSFKYINYVECSEETEKCELKGIEGVPAWEINGVIYEGEQGLQKLSELSGCEVPQPN